MPLQKKRNKIRGSGSCTIHLLKTTDLNWPDLSCTQIICILNLQRNVFKFLCTLFFPLCACGWFGWFPPFFPATLPRHMPHFSGRTLILKSWVLNGRERLPWGRLIMTHIVLLIIQGEIRMPPIVCMEFSNRINKLSPSQKEKLSFFQFILQ